VGQKKVNNKKERRARYCSWKTKGGCTPVERESLCQQDRRKKRDCPQPAREGRTAVVGLETGRKDLYRISEKRPPRWMWNGRAVLLRAQRGTGTNEKRGNKMKRKAGFLRSARPSRRKREDNSSSKTRKRKERPSTLYRGRKKGGLGPGLDRQKRKNANFSIKKQGSNSCSSAHGENQIRKRKERRREEQTLKLGAFLLVEGASRPHYFQKGEKEKPRPSN